MREVLQWRFATSRLDCGTYPMQARLLIVLRLRCKRCRWLLHVSDASDAADCRTIMFMIIHKVVLLLIVIVIVTCCNKTNVKRKRWRCVSRVRSGLEFRLHSSVTWPLDYMILYYNIRVCCVMLYDIVLRNMLLYLEAWALFGWFDRCQINRSRPQ